MPEDRRQEPFLKRWTGPAGVGALLALVVAFVQMQVNQEQLMRQIEAREHQIELISEQQRILLVTVERAVTQIENLSRRLDRHDARNGN